ncbi:helicase with zinc finger domain-like [Oopsacas minuta]|uniref:Helicase with zinc finger domain-like n=1 Tax=Oopsacas minuta TaxID=111878 RepID=A0AAV7KCR0_9METZ|nr:helicase with zinc finger domain-like [Oopsacas minuta]
MDSFETYRVCKDCFADTITRILPTLEKYHYRDGKCKTCLREWIGINVGYYNPHRKWCIIRPRPFNSELAMCQYKMRGNCYREWKCRRAHNQLELEIWIEDEKLLMNRKRPSKPKFGCVICRKEFRDSDNLNTHLFGREHETRAKNMWILPEVGSSIHYTGPIRTRPRPPFGKDSYELCRRFARSERCQFGTGCRHAHSMEELKVWMDALTADRYQRQDQRYNFSGRSRGEQSSSSSHMGSMPSEGGASRYPSDSKPPPQSRARQKYSTSAPPNKTEGEPEHVKEVYRRIGDYGIDPCLRYFPKHIKINCDRSLTVTVEENAELKWLFYLKATQHDELHSIVLCDHKKIFTLGEVFRCSTRGSARMEVKQQFVPNRTNYLISQTFDSDSYFEIALKCKPVVGIYKAQIIFLLKDEILVAKEVKVKMHGEGFINVCENFHIATKQPQVRVTMVQDLLKVNWEHNFELINTNKSNLEYQLPNYIEDNIKSGFYDNLPNEISKEFYAKRFHALLYIEEFEHKRSLMRYDLPDQLITFNSVEKQITIENDYGRNYLEVAPGDTRFLSLKLNHRLFEGYRTFRPPKQAYIIPNGTRKAYEYRVCHTGVDYVVLSINADLIRACQTSGGQALVRFAPERKEYVDMHEVLDEVNLPVLFPIHRKVEVPYAWDVDHLLGLLDYEELSLQQKVAVYSIIDSKYQSFPTIISGPFGCGKTKTLCITTKLISRSFHGARILIVTKTNSSANLYIELLQTHFDTITMYREKLGNKKIMFRHFSKSRSLQMDKEMRDFANIEDGTYKGIRFYELEACTIVITTLPALPSLLPPKSRYKSKSLFSHIFLDEAAQVIEPEACLALSFAGNKTKIALAGDVYQTKPLILSKYGKQYNLDESLLHRFELLPEYQTESLQKCKVELTENFRSQETIVQFLSDLFYDESLKANPPSLLGPTSYPALSFLHVSGDEQSLHGFPSFYNKEEAQLTILALKKFIAAGVKVEKIAVLTTYKAQVRFIIEALKEERASCSRMRHSKEQCIHMKCISTHNINVRNLEGVQGREYDLIIVNTVRTISEINEDMPIEDRVDLGLLDDVTQFNTILTRARGWVLVIGDMDCLLKVGECSYVWNKYVEACDNVNGLFRCAEEFDGFNMETNIPAKKLQPSIRKEASTPVTSKPNIKPPPLSPYDIKYNSLDTFMTTCHRELDNSQNSDVLEAIQKQLNLAKIALETMEFQRYTEQHSILTNYKMESNSPAKVQHESDKCIIDSSPPVVQPKIHEIQHQQTDSQSEYLSTASKPHGADAYIADNNLPAELPKIQQQQQTFSILPNTPTGVHSTPHVPHGATYNPGYVPITQPLPLLFPPDLIQHQQKQEPS